MAHVQKLQCVPVSLLVIPVELLLDHYRGLCPTFQPASDSSWLEENKQNSLLFFSAFVPGEPKVSGLSAGLLRMVCRLGQKYGKRLFWFSQIHIIISQMSWALRTIADLPSPPPTSPTDHDGDGTLWAGGQNCAVVWDNSVLTAGGRDGNHLAPLSLKVVSST